MPNSQRKLSSIFSHAALWILLITIIFRSRDDACRVYKINYYVNFERLILFDFLIYSIFFSVTGKLKTK